MPYPQPAPPPRRTKNSTIILWACGGLVVALVLMAGFVTFMNVVTNDSGDAAAAADVSTPDCSHPSGSREFTAMIGVTNSTDRARDYTITVTFLRGDGSEITTATGHINRLQPGKHARVEAVGVAASEFLISCEVTKVRRA